MRRPVPSLRWQLMLGILLPVALFMGISTVVLYRQALPFLLIMSGGVLFITYVESATMGLLRLFGKQ